MVTPCYMLPSATYPRLLTHTHIQTPAGDDILVGKTVQLPDDPTGMQRFTKRDASLALRPSESGVVDSVRAAGMVSDHGGVL